MIIELSELLRSIYIFIRDKYQDRVNEAFDQASRDIGFVVATTMPMTFMTADNGRIKNISVPDTSPLKGTLMEKALSQVFESLKEGNFPDVKPGAYTVYLVWLPALKFKLRRDWLEPAHWRGPWTEPAHLAQGLPEQLRRAATSQVAGMVWESHEPAHWFNSAYAISAEEAMHISLLDEVYPELRLMDRIVSARQVMPQFTKVMPEVQEPAHFRQIIAAIPELPKEMLAELAQVLRRYGY